MCLLGGHRGPDETVTSDVDTTGTAPDVTSSRTRNMMGGNIPLDLGDWGARSILYYIVDPSAARGAAPSRQGPKF